MNAAVRLSLPLAHLIATVSSSATMLAVMVTAAQGDAASWAVAAVLLSAAVPAIIFAPLAAPLLDKFGPRKVVVVSTMVQAVILLITAAAPTTAVLIAMVAARASVSALDSAALMLLVDRSPRSNAPDSTARAFARLDTARLIGSLIGPLLGGIAAQSLDLSWLFLAQTATVAILGFVAGWYPQKEWEHVATSSTWWHRVTEAPALLFRNNAARAALSGLILAIVFTSIFSTAQTLYSLNVLDLDPIGIAILTQCFVVGRLLGSRIGARVTTDRASTWLLGATAAMGVGLLLPGLVHSSIVAGIGFAAAGLANAVQVAAIRLVVVSAVPDGTRGRALAAMGSVNQTAGVAGTALAAPILVLVGPAGALTVAGAGTLLAAILALAMNRKQPDEPRSPVPSRAAETAP